MRRTGGVPEDPHAAGFQVVRLGDDTALRAGHYLRGRAERVRQVQRRRRVLLGDGPAGGQAAARRQDGGRRLRRHVRPAGARPGRGDTDHRQQRRRAADRLRRGHHQPPAVPDRPERVRDQRQPVPAARRAGTALRYRPRPRDARHRRAGPPRRHTQRWSRGPPGADRGGGRRTQAPQAQGEGAAQARGDAGQHDQAGGPHHRAWPPAQAARPPGAASQEGRRHPGRPARRAARLLADDYVTLSAELARDEAEETAAAALRGRARRRR